jgi:hypothetical protein
MEIGHHLVLSTAHLTCATAQSLERWAALPAAAQPLVTVATHCGWFVSTYEVAPSQGDAMPVEIPPILAFARLHGCAYILFDCDGPEEPSLAVHPW